MLKPFLQKLVAGEHLSENEMANAVGDIMTGSVAPAQIAGFLMALRCRGESVDEICGAARAMRGHMQRLRVTRTPLVDTCGTGGDGTHTFNISTAAAFVVAAAGIAVAKHGNRAVSSKSGSADVLAALGVNLDVSPETVERCIEEIGIGFLFAPHLHPAMRHASLVRRELGVRTLFNVLGPLTNPAGATHQVLGVFDAKLCVPLAECLGRLGSARAWVVHGSGLDELTLTGPTEVAEWDGARVRTFVLTPEDVGMPRCTAADLAGGDAQDNAAIMLRLLAGELRGALTNTVALNAAAALVVAEAAPDLPRAIHTARGLLSEGKAAEKLHQLRLATRA